MAETDSKPLYNASRRLKWLAVFIFAGALGLSAAWYWAAGRIDQTVSAIIEREQANGTNIDCPAREVRGYPFRFGVFCDSLSVADSSAQLTVKAGAFRSAAQFYEPGRIITELDGPIVMNIPGFAEPLTVDTANARTVVHYAEPLPDLISATTDQVAILLGEMILGSAEASAFHARTNGETKTDLDIASRLQRVSVPDSILGRGTLPLLDADIDLTISSGAAGLANGTLGQGPMNGEVRRLAVLLNDDAGVLVSGPYSLDEAGQISAELRIRIIDADAVSAAAKTAFPDFSAQLDLLDSMPRTGEQNDEIELTLNIDSGRMRLGLIPLGTLPPLHQIVSF